MQEVPCVELFLSKSNLVAFASQKNSQTNVIQLVEVTTKNLIHSSTKFLPLKHNVPSTPFCPQLV